MFFFVTIIKYTFIYYGSVGYEVIIEIHCFTQFKHTLLISEIIFTYFYDCLLWMILYHISIVFLRILNLLREPTHHNTYWQKGNFNNTLQILYCYLCCCKVTFEHFWRKWRKVIIEMWNCYIFYKVLNGQLGAQRFAVEQFIKDYVFSPDTKKPRFIE